MKTFNTAATVVGLWAALSVAGWAQDEPTPLTTLSGATLLVKTNGQGRTEITLTSDTGTTYLLKTNGLPPTVFQMNGRSVEVKGEIWGGGSQQMFKVVGPIVPKSKTFEQAALVTMKTGDEGEDHMFLSTASMKMYDVLTNDLPKDYEKYIGKTMDVVADVVTLDGKQWARIIRFVPPKAPPKQATPPAPKTPPKTAPKKPTKK